MYTTDDVARILAAATRNSSRASFLREVNESELHDESFLIKTGAEAEIPLEYIQDAITEDRNTDFSDGNR